MNREEVENIIAEARKIHKIPNLRGADLSGADLRGADLSGADLRRATLSGATLSWATLSGADLSGATLSVADLSGADLRRATLSGATLSGADLSGAGLSEADLSGADLRRATLSGAGLSEADLSGADLDYSCWPLWCGSNGVIVDRKIAAQLAAHFCVLDCDDPDYLKAREAILEFAKTSHRAQDLGLLEVKE